MPTANNNQEKQDIAYMHKALEQASRAFALGEVPVGAIVVYQNKIIAKGYNQRESLQSPTKHAELIAIEKAAKKLGSWRLLDCTLYVTLEPCTMCAGAIVLARIPRVVIGAMDPKAGACGSVLNVLAQTKLNHQPQVTYGINQTECSQILSSFFKQLRSRKKI